MAVCLRHGHDRHGVAAASFSVPLADAIGHCFANRVSESDANRVTDTNSHADADAGPADSNTDAGPADSDANAGPADSDANAGRQRSNYVQSAFAV